MLPVPGLEFASHAEVLHPPFTLVLLVPLNLAFLIVCPSWDWVMPHLPALNEAGCCLSLPNRPDKTNYINHVHSEAVSPLHCSHCWQISTASHRDGGAHVRGLCEPGSPMVSNSSTSTPPFFPGDMADIFPGSNFFHPPVAA